MANILKGDLSNVWWTFGRLQIFNKKTLRALMQLADTTADTTKGGQLLLQRAILGLVRFLLGAGRRILNSKIMRRSENVQLTRVMAL